MSRETKSRKLNKYQKKNRIKKIYILAILTVIFCNLGIKGVLADDELENLEEREEIQQQIEEASSEITDEPNINSRAAVVMDRKSKMTVYSKHANERRPMASTTKIMTAIVVLENGRLEDVVEVSKKAAGIGGSRLGLKTGDKITVNDLLYGLMLCSGNDAAIALSEYIGGSVQGFADKMNAKAKELNLKNTHFVVPHGLDNPEHYTTAYELALMADYGLKNEKFAKIVQTQVYTLSINGYAKTIHNTNELLGNLEGVKGVKTGFTNGAGRCLVTYIQRGGEEYISVVLGADTKKFRTKDSIKIIEYAFTNYSSYDIRTKVEEEFKQWKEMNEKRIQINKGEQTSPELILSPLNYSTIPVKKTKENAVKIEITSLNYLEAPVAEETTVGTLRVKIGEEIIENLEIKTKGRIEKKNVFFYWKELIGKYPRLLDDI
ncbi:MAG: D-alanyl-D-alanine carboxypeptidase family protein [Clostridia bacterium]